MDRIGEPYVTSRRRRGARCTSGEASGLGLGFFIAKTLLERSGATLDFENRAFPERGAVVRGALGPRRFRAADGVRACKAASHLPMRRTGCRQARRRTLRYIHLWLSARF